MLTIDGSKGEGGGQILRTSLAISVLTCKGVRIEKIRAGRKKPGLMPQHLKAVEAAAAVGQAQVEGARPGSTSLLFRPSALRPGEYQFDIGTAGSTMLVLQTVLLPLAFAGGDSRVTITGGTHVLWSPCFDYIDLHLLPYLRAMGVDATLSMERAGFYPRGGGCVEAIVRGGGIIAPLDLSARGRLRRVRIVSAVGNLDLSVAERQSRQVERRLECCSGMMEVESVIFPAIGRGTLLLVLAEFEKSRCCFYALGERGKRAEKVADEAADAFLEFLEGDAAVDQYLADQLLLPLSLASGVSRLRTAKVTQHLVTNAWVLEQFLPVKIRIGGPVGSPALVEIEGCSLRGFQ